jgi:hypothetical protein
VDREETMIKQKIINDQWLEFSPIELNQYLVLRRWNETQYVVHYYNSSDNGYYNGSYTSDLEKAQKVYQQKLAFYRGEKPLPSPRPDGLMEALDFVRTTNHCNMADLIAVCELMYDLEYWDVPKWLESHSWEYADVLTEFSEWLNRPKPKSLAQQLADEMGWEVIVD